MAGLLLLGTWVATAVGFVAARSLEVTFEDVLAHLNAPVPDDPAARRAWVDGAVDGVRRLSSYERVSPGLHDAMRSAVIRLPGDEAARLVDGTMPPGLGPTLDALAGMPADRRRRLFSQAVRGTPTAGGGFAGELFPGGWIGGGGDAGRDVERAMIKALSERNPRDVLAAMTPAQRLELQPVLFESQRSLRLMGPRPWTSVDAE